MTTRTVPLTSLVDELASSIGVSAVEGPLDLRVTGVAQDSRAVRPGDLFLAWKGTAFDANDAVAEAVGRGAVAALVERPTPGVPATQIVVEDGRVAAASAASWYYGHPSRDLFLVGVTGTNGKTTTAALVRALLSRKGPAAAIGTLGLVQSDGSVRPGTEALTTPGPVELAAWLRGLSDDDVRHVAMEVSSHALDQHRVDGLRFDAAVFTNLSQDHLDYHRDLEAYRDAKLRLVDLLEPGGTLVLNAEEPAWRGAERRRSDVSTLTFGFHPDASLRATALRADTTGSSFELAHGGRTLPAHLPLLGRFNVENALGAAGAGLAAGMSLDDVVEALAEAPQVVGRLERVVAEPFTVLVDYAHTPEALERVLETLRPLVAKRMLVVFGAGGDRDPGKRPRMGAAVARWADLCIVTSDNPRTEAPEAIIDQILPGVGAAPHVRITDRREAIAYALREAAPGDLVLLAGKGHETYQVIGTERRPFDERAIVADALEERGA